MYILIFLVLILVSAYQFCFVRQDYSDNVFFVSFVFQKQSLFRIYSFISVVLLWLWANLLWPFQSATGEENQNCLPAVAQS